LRNRLLVIHFHVHHLFLKLDRLVPLFVGQLADRLPRRRCQIQ
jgi:hypothetical protein